MKWFKHETNAHTNMKLQTVVDKYGLEAYGYYWVCVELVGLESENYRILSEKGWKNHLRKFIGLDLDKQNKFLAEFAIQNLIDKKALNKGDLYIPKLGERSDDYTKRVRRVSEQPTDNIHLEEKRREESRKKRVFINSDKEQERRELLNKQVKQLEKEKRMT